MKNKYWLTIFSIDVIADLICSYIGLNNLRFVTKPLIVLILIVYCISEIRNEKLFIPLISALLFSLFGDVLLLCAKYKESFFIFGLINFLVAHGFFILLFLQLKRKNQPQKKLNLKLSTLILLYSSFLFLLIRLSLNDLTIPVLVYATVLSLMVIACFHAFNIKKQLSGKFCVSGALLFLLSDSLLAINKFFREFTGAEILIMLTYASAQLLIVIGVIKYMKKIQTNI